MRGVQSWPSRALWSSSALLLLCRIGRRWPLCLFHVFGGLVCIASPFVPPTTGTSYELLPCHVISVPQDDVAPLLVIMSIIFNETTKNSTPDQTSLPGVEGPEYIRRHTSYLSGLNIPYSSVMSVTGRTVWAVGLINWFPVLSLVYDRFNSSANVF